MRWPVRPAVEAAVKFARSRREAVVGIILLVLLAVAWMVFIDERLSKQLDDVDLTYEEYIAWRDQ